MRIGTKSVLYGAHCWFIHPIFVAIAWIKLFGFPKDPRIWIAFTVHDLGYWGCLNIDGPDGEDHVFLGARIMGRVFDPRSPTWDEAGTWVGRWLDKRYGHNPEGLSWFRFTFFHSRFMAKRYGSKVSRLCIADKLAIAIEPWWLYLPRTIATGEWKEWSNPKYIEMNNFKVGSIRSMHAEIQTHLKEWVSIQALQ